MRRLFGCIVVAAVFLNGCVPNRKVVYLQKDDLKKKDVPLDSVVRTHTMEIREYRIQPLDLLSIRFESLTDEDYDFISKLYPNVQQVGGGSGGGAQYINGFLVDDNGELEFPVSGKIKLAGLSLFEASKAIQAAFRPFLKDPVVRVQLLNFRFTVLGEVNVEHQVISQNSRVTLMEAIGMVGGLTDLADRSKIKIVRQSGAESQVIYMNLLDENLLSSENYYVHQNDLIVVPALKQRPFRKYWLENVTLIVSSLSLILLVVTLAQK